MNNEENEVYGWEEAENGNKQDNERASHHYADSAERCECE